MSITEAADEQRTAKADAMEFLQAVLAGDPVPATEVSRMAPSSSVLRLRWRWRDLCPGCHGGGAAEPSLREAVRLTIIPAPRRRVSIGLGIGSREGGLFCLLGSSVYVIGSGTYSLRTSGTYSLRTKTCQAISIIRRRKGAADGTPFGRRQVAR
jgi:hypothetical protein